MAEMAKGRIEVRNLYVSYGDTPVLWNVSLDIPPKQIFGIIGPANSGKTTLLKTINRTVEFTPGVTVKGRVLIDGLDIRCIRNVYELRRRIGMVFPLPVGLP
ncbi:MAG: ATP-binding cassette domain-containing protein, partial [Kiritimatiellae bacterium]|nr:ATP-binding cassette domain-containing protein [Kiritimatiellia bacterium]